MGNAALQTVCVRDDSIDMYTEELAAIEDAMTDSTASDRSSSDTIHELQCDFYSGHLDKHLPHDDRSSRKQRRRTLKFRNSIVSRPPSTPTQPLDAYEEVCQQFNVVFEANAKIKNAPTTKTPQSEDPFEDNKEIDEEPIVKPSIDADEPNESDNETMSTTSTPDESSYLEDDFMDETPEDPYALSKWPSDTWKIDLQHNSIDEEDEVCSTACSSDCESDEEPESTFACTYHRSASSSGIILLDDVPFEFTRRSMFIVSDYICPCGECPWYDMIEKQVANTCGLSTKLKRQVCRILQAYSTYNEVTGYRSGMIRIAQDCLFTCQGKENDAFEAFVECVESQYANGWL
ncbi:unnamed protein product [Aphanomyces euteiches]